MTMPARHGAVAQSAYDRLAMNMSKLSKGGFNLQVLTL